MTIENLLTQQGSATVVGIVLVLLSAVEISPLKINPWSCLARYIGKAMNAELIAKVDKLTVDVEAQKQEDAEREAKEWRYRILCFGDELYTRKEHTKEMFDQVLEDISAYKAYCHDHPEFKNEKTVMTVKHIEAVYEKCLLEHGFL